MMTHCYKKRGYNFVQNPVRKVCAKFKVVQTVFILELIKHAPPRKLSLAKFL